MSGNTESTNTLSAVLGPEFCKGQRLIAYADGPLHQQVFIEVTRAAKDGSWVDIACHTWAVRWTKRIPAETLGRTAQRFHWSQANLDEQMAAWDRAHMHDLLGAAA